MITIYQSMLMTLNGSPTNSAIELSQNSIDSLSQLTAIITITFIPLSIILIYLYFSLKKSKAKIHITK